MKVFNHVSQFTHFGKILHWSKMRVFADVSNVVQIMGFVLNCLSNDKFLDWSKLKAFAHNNINVTQKLKIVLGQLEDTVGKGQNAGYHHFFLFPQCFQKPSFSGSLKVLIVWYAVNCYKTTPTIYDPDTESF